MDNPQHLPYTHSVPNARASSVDHSGVMARNKASNRAAGPTGVGRERCIRQRSRAIKACISCRKRKIGCDKGRPCINCTNDQLECSYVPLDLQSEERRKLNRYKEGIHRFENALERDVAKRVNQNQPRGSDREEVTDPYETESCSEPDDEKDLQATPYATTYNFYEDDAEDTFNDLGFVVGKMRVTDRIGNLFRPKMAEELTGTLKDRGLDGRSQGEEDISSETPQPYVSRAAASASRRIFDAGPTYIAPTPRLCFYGISYELMELLVPPPEFASWYVEAYWSRVHPIARVLHRPWFEKRYETFCNDLENGRESPYSLQSLVFAVMFSGVLAIPNEIHPEKTLWVGKLQDAVEDCLARANVIRTTNIETLQAFVVYLIPLCRAEVSRAHSTLVAAAIRVAETNGLNQDSTALPLTPVGIHVRRMIWYQLSILDIRTCEAQGPHPIIHTAQVTARLPLNVDDDELEAAHPPEKDADRWTDMTLARIRIECNEFIRVVYNDRARVAKKEPNFTVAQVLGKIEKFRKVMQIKYRPLINDNEPIQRYGKLILELSISRTYAMVLHPYHMTVSEKMPDRLREMLIENGILCMETVLEIETSPTLDTWLWYAGALQQHHYALLMLMDIFAHPDQKEAHRIWRCLDYVFEVPSDIPFDQKGRWVVTQVRDKMEQFVKARKLCCPQSMNQIMPSPNGRRSSRNSSTGSTVPGTTTFSPVSNASSGMSWSMVSSSGSAEQMDTNLSPEAMKPNVGFKNQPTNGFVSVYGQDQPTFAHTIANSGPDKMHEDWTAKDPVCPKLKADPSSGLLNAETARLKIALYDVNMADNDVKFHAPNNTADHESISGDDYSQYWRVANQQNHNETNFGMGMCKPMPPRGNAMSEIPSQGNQFDR